MFFSWSYSFSCITESKGGQEAEIVNFVSYVSLITFLSEKLYLVWRGLYGDQVSTVPAAILLAHFFSNWNHSVLNLLSTFYKIKKLKILINTVFKNSQCSLLGIFHPPFSSEPADGPED